MDAQYLQVLQPGVPEEDTGEVCLPVGRGGLRRAAYRRPRPRWKEVLVEQGCPCLDWRGAFMQLEGPGLREQLEGRRRDGGVARAAKRDWQQGVVVRVAQSLPAAGPPGPGQSRNSV